MKPNILCILFGSALVAWSPAAALSPNWEDLTGADFSKALQASQGVCILPFGSIEKFGPSGPLGTNLYMARAIATEAAKQEYAIVFPAYYVAQTADVSNHVGTISYSSDLQHEMLEATVDEMGRNGCKKIIISNGHSGNMGLIQWFIQSSMERARPYVVYGIYPTPPGFSPMIPQLASLPKDMQPSKPDADGHGGEERISVLMAIRPDLVHVERAHDEKSAASSGHGGNPTALQAGTARAIEAPTSYVGDASGATPTRGRALLKFAVDQLVSALRTVKADVDNPKVQKEFEAERASPR